MQLVWAGIGFGLVTSSILAIAAVGFTLQIGIANIFNLSYGAVMIASAFAAYGLNAAGLSIWLCIPAAAAVGAVVSVALHQVIFRPFLRRGTQLFAMVIVTLGVGTFIQNALAAGWGPGFFTYRFAPGPTLHLGGMLLSTSQLALIGTAVALMGCLHLLLTETKMGKAMRATAADAALARGCGIRTDRISQVVWAVSGALCGLAGVAFAINTVSFQFASGSDFLILVVAAAMLGGAGQPYGAMLGALVVGIASELSATTISPDFKNVIALLILIAVLLVRPQGLMASVDVTALDAAGVAA